MASGSVALLSQLRERMAQMGLAAVIVPTADPHLSEYVADRYQRRAFLTNFHGSAGTAVVTADKALLWTDGRYWVEASKCLLPEWELMKDGLPATKTIEDWLAKNIAKGVPVGADPFTFSTAQWTKYSKRLNLLPVGPPNIIDEVWGSAIPAIGKKKIVSHPIQFAGSTIQEKLTKVCEKLRDSAVQMCFVSALDDVAWLFNLRGSDIQHVPVFYAYAAVEDGPEGSGAKAALFVDREQLSEDALESLLSAAVSVEPYDGLETYFKARKGKLCVIDEQQTTVGVKLLMTLSGIDVRADSGVVAALKVVKNNTEVDGFRKCHIRDGAALTAFLAWLEERITNDKNEGITEVDAATKLAEFRAQQDLFQDLSFPTISSVGSNAAIIHYHAQPDTAAKITMGELYLVDSGGQYLDGTTDVTRTVCFSAPREREKEAYTLVLKGNIALNTLVFPSGTTGHRLDAFARQHLWKLGLNYAHGTGHGVGSYLNVHEGPEGIGQQVRPSAAGLQKGIVLSNEPGYYKDGEFGIRIENLEVLVAKETKYGTGKPEFLTFDTLTMAPLCPALIDTSLLTSEETAWINRYHQEVREKLSPLLEKDPLAMAYLLRTTAPLH